MDESSSDQCSETNDCDGDAPLPKIKITVSEEGIPLIWDPEDWLTLRQKHRIVGNLIGLSVPYPYNEGVNGLPMTLQPWEATVLLFEELAEIVYYPSLSRIPEKHVKDQFDRYREKIVQEQMNCLLEERKKEVSDNLEDIAEGKKQKLMGNSRKKKKLLVHSNSKSSGSEPSTSTEADAEVDKFLILEEEISKISAPCLETTLVQTFTKYPWLNESDACEVQWRYPSNRRENLLYCVFHDLWRRGYYTTSGEKFGSDFLVYPGDPVKFHAHYLVICVHAEAAIRPSEIATLCRLGNSVHKTAVFASLTDDAVVYNSVAWIPNKCD